MVSHKDMVTSLVKPGEDILTSLTPEKCHIWHMASCIPEEAGEVFGVVKKHLIYGKALDREKLILEMGDLEFYLEGLRQELGITRDEVLDANVAKLSERYENLQYSDQAARDRVDQGHAV